MAYTCKVFYHGAGRQERNTCMHSLVTTFLDALFPPSEHAACVRDTTFDLLAKACVPHAYGDTIALASYHHPIIRACIHEAKFRHNKHAIALLGRLLGERLTEVPHGEVRLVPIPLSDERLRERGYNQAHEIALSAQSHDPYIQVHETILRKIQHTSPQTSLTREERLKNLNGVFAVGEHALPFDTHLTLFDDIITTGATLAEASRTLKEAGFTHIDQLALAH